MAKNSAVNLDITNNADGFDISGGTTKRKLTISNSNINLIGGGAYNHTLPAATDTLVGRTISQTLTNKNLSLGTAIGATILPDIPNIYNLGSTSFRFNEIFANDLTIGSTSFLNVINTSSTGGSCAINQSSSVCDLEIGLSSSTFDPRGVCINQYNTGTEAGMLSIRKARGTGTTTVANGDGIADVRFQAYGTTMATRARIQATVNGTVSGNIVPGQLSFSTMNTSGTLGVRAIISPAGNFTLGSTEGTGAADLFLNKVKKSSATQSSSSWSHEMDLSQTTFDLHSTSGYRVFMDINNDESPGTANFQIFSGNGTYRGGTVRWQLGENGDVSQTSANTTATAHLITADSLTTAAAFRVASNSSSSSTRNLVSLLNDNTSATGATVLALTQDSTARALFIDHNDAGNAIEIASDANTATAMVGLLMEINNAGAGLEYAFRFNGAEIVSSAVGGTQDKKIRVSVAGVDYFIPLHTA